MIADSRKRTLKKFNGAHNVPTGATGQAYQSDATLVPIQNGLLAKNCSFFGDGSTTTRYGNPRVFTPGNIVRSMINWLPIVSNAPSNYLTWLAQGTGIKLTSLASPGAGSTIMAETTSVAASLTPLGARLYAGFMNAAGIGVAPGQVYDVNINAATPLFAAPITGATITVTNGSGSFTTPGVKNYGFVINTKTGFTTVPCNVTSSTDNTFVPTAATTDGSSINISIAATWPSYAKSISIIMTTSANPNDYFLVPIAFAIPVVGGTTSTVTQTLVATDDYITTNWLDASVYFGQLSNTISGVSPIDPAVIVPYGQRMCYVTLDGSGVPVVYVSEPGNPQQVSAAFGGIYLPGNLPVVNAFAIGRVLYISSNHGTYSTTDNNAEPSTWAQPQLIDGLIGCAGPFCASVAASQTYAWIADVTGFWLFSGTFADRPISYYQGGDWNRINFSQITKISIIDDKTNLRVHVIAPLDGATNPTHILTWDYSLRSSDSVGMNVSPEEVKYSIDNIQNYSLACGCIVQNYTSKRSERWLAPYDAAQYVLRQAAATDSNPFRDDATQPIDSKYQTSLLPDGGNIGQVYQHHGAHVRVTGTAANLTASALDGSTTAGPYALTVTTQPGAEILRQFYILSEGCSLTLDNGNTIDQWFKWSGATHYFTDSFPQR